MAGSDVKLLGGRPSPFVNRVQFALNLKSVNYEFLVEKYPEEKKSDLLLKSNPVYKKMPVLIHGDKPLCESLVIVQYIDEAWTNGPSILPSDIFDRATARFWAAYIDEKLFPALRGLSEAKDEESKAAVMEKLAEGFAYLEDAFVKSSEGKGFFGGANIGYVDLALGCYLAWIRVIEISANVKIIDETKNPGLFGWADKFKSHGAVKGTLPETEELLEFYKAMQARAAAAAAETPK